MIAFAFPRVSELTIARRSERVHFLWPPIISPSYTPEHYTALRHNAQDSDRSLGRSAELTRRAFRRADQLEQQLDGASLLDQFCPPSQKYGRWRRSLGLA